MQSLSLPIPEISKPFSFAPDSGNGQALSEENSILAKLNLAAKKLAKEPIIKNLHKHFLQGATVLNSASALTNLLSKSLLAPKILSKSCSFLGQLSTSLSFLATGLSTTIDNLAKNNYIMAFGHAIDIAVAFLPQSLSFLAHGFASGLYCLGAALNTAINKNDFSNGQEYVKEMKKALQKIFASLKEDPKKNILNEKTGALGVLASTAVLAGASIWKLTGSKIFGATIRNIGELLLISNQINPQNKHSKPNYFRSGKKAVVSTIVDYIAKIIEPKFKEILYPLSLALFFNGQTDYIKYQRSPEINNGYD